ncbi:MAG: DDE-type integrase/transposase/recombinase [Candidatus Nanoarchaeia archaeon]
MLWIQTYWRGAHKERIFCFPKEDTESDGGMGLKAIHPKPNLSKVAKEHKKFPYLLKELEIQYPNHVWVADITYLRLGDTFVYLVAILDLFSRKVLSWRISNTLDADFCVEALREAIDYTEYRKYSIQIRVANLQAKSLYLSLKVMKFKLAWIAKGERLTMFISNVFGAR